MTDQTATEIRGQLLRALDFNYVTGVLGYGTPEELLAAYDASRAPAGQVEAVLRVVEMALGDTLVASARDEALAGIAAVLHAAPADQAAVLRWAADELDRYVGLQSSNAAPEVEGARLVIRELRRMADETPAAETTEPRRPCRAFVSGGTVWCCEEGETDCPCVCHQPAAGARQDGAQPDFTSPIAGRIEVRDPCPYCGDRQMIPRHQFAEHVARLHPDARKDGAQS